MDVLQRDQHRCLSCGRTVRDGVKLHVDHIEPESLGGKTELGNLQTLCADCNIGKSNRYSDDLRG
jgi:5-methylcytosine-specific restriction endonuclease McrA